MSFLHKAAVTIHTEVVYQPSGIRCFCFGVSLLSPLRPILRNGKPFIELLGIALTFERALQRPTPKSSVDNRPAENALPNLSATAVAPGSWAHVRRGQPNEETDCRSSCRCQGGPGGGKDYWK